MRFDGIASDGEEWLVVSKAGCRVVQCQLALLPVVDGYAVVELAPNAGRHLVLECRDDQGNPLPGVDVGLKPIRFGDQEIWVGTSSAAGTVEVGPLVDLIPCEFWFRGPVYTTRWRVERQPENDVVVVRLPRPVRGELLLDAGGEPKRVRVGVVDAGVSASPRAAQYVNAMGRWMTTVDGRIALDLPCNRAVTVSCRDTAGRSGEKRFTATEAGWQLALELGEVGPSHEITIIPRGRAIESILLGWYPVEFWRSGDVVSFRAPDGFVGMEVYDASGKVGLALSGRLDGDVLLDVPMPESQRVQFSVRDPEGDPVPDIAVEFRRTSSLSRDLIAGTSFKMFQIPNHMQCEVDALGNGSVELVAGSHEVWVRNASFRDHLGAWRPVEGAGFEVPCSEPLRIVTTRPRRVTVRLGAGVRDPSLRWLLWGPNKQIRGAFRGAAGIIWCSDDEHVLTARAEGGRPLGEVRIPAGAGGCEVEVVPAKGGGR